MLKDYYYSVLVSRKSLLKSDKTSITYREMLGFTSVKSLIEHLAHEEADKLGYGSIDDISSAFIKKFNINLGEYANWDEIVEASFRRNLFIHNKGKTNDKYCKRVGFTRRNKKLEVDVEYVARLSENLVGFNEYCFEHLRKKFRL